MAGQPHCSEQHIVTQVVALWNNSLVVYNFFGIRLVNLSVYLIITPWLCRMC